MDHERSKELDWEDNGLQCDRCLVEQLWFSWQCLDKFSFACAQTGTRRQRCGGWRWRRCGQIEVAQASIWQMLGFSCFFSNIFQLIWGQLGRILVWSRWWRVWGPAQLLVMPKTASDSWFRWLLLVIRLHVITDISLTITIIGIILLPVLSTCKIQERTS